MRISTVLVLILMCLIATPVPAQENAKPGTGDLYRYEDADGNLHLVDRIEKVPEAYRNSLDRVPRNPELTQLGNSITRWIQSGESVAALNRLFVHWVYVTIPVGAAVLVLLLCFVLPFFVRTGAVRAAILIGGLFTFLVLHTVWTAPVIQERVRSFSRTLTASAPRALDSGRWIRYEARTLEITRRPVPLNPIVFHGDVLSLIHLHQDLFQP